jgi:hypothetical protein
VPDPVGYTAVLPIGEPTVAFVSGLLDAERRRRGTRRGRRALDSTRQAVPALRWFLDASRVAQLAPGNQISSSTAYRHLHEATDVLAAVAPGLHGALLAARSAGHSHVSLDGTPIRTDRSKAAGPAAKVGLRWSGKHHHHGGNVQVATAPDGWPSWTSPVRPGREHDVPCARTHPGLLDALDGWTDHQHVVLADPGHLGGDTRPVCPIRKPGPKPGTRASKNAVPTVEQRTVNALHPATRAPAERGNSLLETTFKALRQVSFCPWRIGAITAAALVLPHHEHDRTTDQLATGKGCETR